MRNIIIFTPIILLTEIKYFKFLFEKTKKLKERIPRNSSFYDQM